LISASPQILSDCKNAQGFKTILIQAVFNLWLAKYNLSRHLLWIRLLIAIL
jgi:hypothetical protein